MRYLGVTDARLFFLRLVFLGLGRRGGGRGCGIYSKNPKPPPDPVPRHTALEAKEDYDSPEYQKIMMEDLYPKMICRVQPWPEPVSRAFRHVNDKIYNLMQGKSEFLVTGNLKTWERWDRLHEIKVKTLTIGAQYDEMAPEDMKKTASLMPNASYAFFPND